MLYRLKRVVSLPFSLLYAKLRPVAFARRIGVNIKGRVKIYGSSYEMFSSEPFLVTLGDNVFISADALFVCHDGGVLPFRELEPELDVAAPIVVGDNVFIGTRAVILKGVNIGNNCIIGACALVTRDVADGTIVAGNPARVVRTTDQYLINARKNSLHIGHLPPDQKIKKYKSLFPRRGQERKNEERL